MTDVTGFGLAGHLQGMCDASSVGARVILGDVPMMQGAVALAEAGLRSSLFADNKRGINAPEGALSDLMFDPQTAGGLLAAVKADQAATLCADLQQAGYAAAQIGHMTAEMGLRFTD